MVKRLFLIVARDGIFNQPQLRAEIAAGNLLRQKHKFAGFFAVSAGIGNITQQTDCNGIKRTTAQRLLGHRLDLGKCCGILLLCEQFIGLARQGKRMVGHISERQVGILVPRDVGNRVNEGQPCEIYGGNGDDDNLDPE